MHHPSEVCHMVIVDRHERDMVICHQACLVVVPSLPRPYGGCLSFGDQYGVEFQTLPLIYPLHIADNGGQVGSKIFEVSMCIG
jgi:hypothetical protein